MKTRRIEVTKPIIDKTANQVNFCCSRKDGVPVITETDVQFRKTSLGSVNVEKIWALLFRECGKRREKETQILTTHMTIMKKHIIPNHQ